MAANADPLIRFLLPESYTRGAIIRGSGIVAEAARMHGLSGVPAELFGSALLASILLLSVSKGGLRQVLQIDASPNQPHAPIRRMLSEARPGMVRGYMHWQEEHAAMRDESASGISTWMGHPLRISTVRDLGFGNPYVSTIEHDSDFLADHILHYLTQSVQIHADVVLRGDLAILLEAMPGCDQEHWFQSVEALAKISDQTLDEAPVETILAGFTHLGCKEVGRDMYAYHCQCNPQSMADTLLTIPHEQLQELADSDGHITIACQYCDKSYTLSLDALDHDQQLES